MAGAVRSWEVFRLGSPLVVVTRYPQRIAVLLSLIIAGGVTGQTSRGTLTGIVTDAQGAAVAGAKIAVVNEATNVERQTTANEAGLYRFDAVDPGSYSVTVTFPGFTIVTKRHIPVAAAQTVSHDVRLEVSESQQTVEVVAKAETELQLDNPVRGGSLAARQITNLPLANRRPTHLALTLPGVSTNRFGPGSGGLFNNFSVNGMRPRGNNFMIDGTENNDISTTGEGLSISNPDAVAEVSVLTSNFDAEFGRSAGAVVNIITRSGTNQFHGTLSYVLDSTYDDAITNTQSLSAAIRERGRPPFGIEQWWGGTLGGPIKRDRTFFFASFQEQRQRLLATNRLRVPSAAGWETLGRVFPQGTNPNLELYRDLTSELKAAADFFNEPLGGGRPDVQFGSIATMFSTQTTDRQVMGRVDHSLGPKDQLSFRYILTDQATPSGALLNIFPGFEASSAVRNSNASLVETHVFSPGLTNELRINYNRLNPVFPADATHPRALTSPQVQFTQTQITTIGLDSRFPQGRTGNNYSLQDTVTFTTGAHSLRFGADLLQQRSRQFAPIVERGFLDIRAGGGYGAFANFLDDFAGSGGAVQRDFGRPVYYPSLNRLAFFLSDRWRATQSLTLTLGLRYEYFGTAMNSLYKSAAGALFDVDPVTFRGSFMEPSQVSKDLNNFSPSVGLAWSPSYQDGLLGKLMGNRKTVVRTGYTIGYDSFFNNIASNAQTSTPNVISTVVASTTAQPRGLPGALRSLPATPREARPNDNQNLMSGNLRNPYVQRWSFGIQRQVPWNIIYDLSYVGSKGTRLFVTEDQNPLVPADLQVLPQSTVPIPPERRTGRLDSLQGPRSHRTNGGDSNYHSLQMMASKRFSAGLQFTAAYTWAKLIDNGSEAFNIAAANSPLAQGVPPMFGGLQLDRGLSTFHRTHRAVFAYLYELPFYRSQRGLLGRIAGGWQLSGITTFESGVPLNVLNGVDADGVGGSVADRPDFNPNGIPGTRAVPNPASPTGYVNPDAANAPIDPATARYIGVRFLAGQRQPSRPGNAGRNLEFTPGINNFNVAVTKEIRLTEGWRLQLRGDSFNVFNHPQYASPSVSPFAGGPQAVPASVFGSAAGQFLRPQFADGGGRVMRYELRLRF